MNEYLTYQLWKQREERMPQELELQRVIEERMVEQKLAVSPEHADAVSATVAERPSADEYVLVDE